jgi:hypothetical protein
MNASNVWTWLGIWSFTGFVLMMWSGMAMTENATRRERLLVIFLCGPIVWLLALIVVGIRKPRALGVNATAAVVASAVAASALTVAHTAAKARRHDCGATLRQLEAVRQAEEEKLRRMRKPLVPKTEAIYRDGQWWIVTAVEITP